MRKIYKKGLSLICALGVFTTVFSSASGYLGSDITAKAADAITISTGEELQKIGKDDAYPLSGDYVLGADIDMSGVDFTPIGGGVGNRGAYNSTDANVFSGTFDGAGHVISNLTIQESGSSDSSWQYGMFGMIGSGDNSDYAVVKNLILTDVDISVNLSGNGYLSLGVLAGEVNHNATIDNIAIVNGTVEGNISNGADMVGTGGLIGEIRYSTGGQGRPGQQTTSINNVSISNVYVGADVVAGSSRDNNYVGGIVGRIAYSNVTSMTGCIFTGTPTFKGSEGRGISGGDMTGNIRNCYYVKGSVNTGTAVVEEDLKAATLLDGLLDSYWVANEGSYMMPKQCIESETLADILALTNLSLELEGDDTLAGITTDFKVPVSIEIEENTEAITWTSNAPEGVITIDTEGNVTLGEVWADTSFVLTATTETGKTKSFNVTVLTKVGIKIDQEYAVVGEPLTATFVDAPEDMACTYVWTVDGVEKSTQNTYTPTEADLMKNITVRATSDYGIYEASLFFSKLPVVYVNTEGGAPIVSKEDYLDATLKIQGNSTYNTQTTTLYDGITEIRGRGNTTWGYPKKPYKMKLDKKTDIFGFGANKHWVLLANYTDESHMRNMLSYNLSGEMGMPYMQSVHVDLILNGEYKGTYQFCEQVKISKARVNIHDWEDYAEDVAKAIYAVEKDDEANPLTKDDRDEIETILAETDMSWMTTDKVTYNGITYTISDYIEDVPAATGGFLIELDGYYDEVSKFRSSKNQPLMYKSPEFINTNKEVMSYVENYINAFEKAIDASDFTTTYNNETVSYSQLFDMDSLVQFWLVQELFNNVDAMKKSTYMYKDIDGIFHMGPIWDMDWSSNSLVSQYQGSGTYNAWQTVQFSDAAQANQWYKSIIKDPYFAVKAYELYTNMRDEMQSIIADGGKIDTYRELIKESANVNTQMWYSGENNKIFTTQTAALKTYLTNRLGWLDNQFTSPETLAKALGYTSAGGITVEAVNIVAKGTDVTAITANVTNTSVKSAEFMVNGLKTGVVEVKDGKATIEVPTEDLYTKEYLNTVQVFGLNANGGVITLGNSKVTDFETFHADGSNESGNTGDGGNTGDNGNAGDGGNTGDNGNTGDGGNTGDDGNTGDNGNAGDGGNTEDNGNAGDGSNTGNTGDGSNAGNGGNTDEGGTQTPDTGENTEVKQPEVKLNVTSANMQKKQKTTAIQIVSRYPAEDTVLSWESSDSKIVSVNKNGKITAKKIGKATITVTMKSGAKASCKINVQKGKVKTKKLSAVAKKITLKKGKTANIALNRTPVTANDQVIYVVKNKKIATVNSKGKIKALKKGTTKVTVKAGSKKIQITIKVK